jgi:tetratricopeptide (TPR) repeat protein
LLSALADVCQAVAALHRNGLVHGGINPATIAVEQGEQPKAYLLCFEPFLARPTGYYLRGNGALAFVPQEQLRGGGGLASDIYALGMLLYAGFGAQSPFDGAPPYELAERVIWGDMVPFRPYLDDLDPAVAEAIATDVETIWAVAAKALQRDPAARYTTVTQMHRPLKQIAERLSPISLGHRLYQEGRHRLAVTVLEEAAKMPGNFLGANLLLGRIYGMELGDYMAAVTAFKRVLKQHPGLYGARRSLAEVYALHGRFGLAKRELSDMLMQSPDDPELMMAYALVLQQSGQPREALNVMRRVQEVSPYHLRAYLAAMQVSDAQSNYKEAEADCLQALNRIAEVIDKGNLDPNQMGEVYYWRGLLHHRLARPEPAIRWLEKALEQKPSHPQSHLLLAELYAEAGQMAQSLQHLMSGLRIDPSQKGIMDLISRIFISQAP